MSKSHVLRTVIASVLTGSMYVSLVHAQDTTQQEYPAQQQDTAQQQYPAQQQGTAQQHTQSPQTDESTTTTPGTANPMPSTQRTEGTAADTTAPGATQTRSPATTTPGTANPMPATRPGEGTAADRSPPGETPVRGTAASQAPEQATTRMAMAQGQASSHRGSSLIGMQVRDNQGQQVGSVKDIVINPASGQITHAIVSHSGQGGAQTMTAVPWQTAQRMMSGNGIVIDQAKLSSAPHFQSNEWPDMSQRAWSDAADRYWRGKEQSGN